MLKEKMYAMKNQQTARYLVVVGGRFAAVPIPSGKSYIMTQITQTMMETGEGFSYSDYAITGLEAAEQVAEDVGGVLFEVMDTTVVTRNIKQIANMVPPMAPPKGARS